ncbi:MAG: hypothetical protein JSV86_18465 [Gemmatimonadota bacterium]|nr:MAG: hypothetical protein JSV86_18465 [Gemmatimonadota bacterium]
MTTHAEAREIVARAVPGIGPQESLAVRVIGLLESHYGDFWKHPGVGSNNWGAITKGTWTGPTFEYTDSRWDPKLGKKVYYQIGFRKYPTPEAGARDVYDHLVGRRHGAAMVAARDQDWLTFSRRLRESQYYLGNVPKEEAIAGHQRKVVSALKTITRATGEKTRIPTPPAKPGTLPRKKASAPGALVFIVIGLGLVWGVGKWRRK